MKFISFKILTILILCLATAAFSYPGKILKKIPAPGRFASGLTFDGRNLWLADYQADKLFKIDPANGTVLTTLPSPGFWPMGLAWDGEFLWNVDKKQKKIFQVDPQSGHILKAIDSPSGDPEGLCWDGQTLWISDARANLLMKLDLSDGTAVKKFDGPARSLNGLTFDGSYLWAGDRYQDELYMIDPTNGEVLVILDAPGKYARGLAWDRSCLWNVDYQSDSLYQLVRQDDETYVLKDTRHARVTFTHEMKVYGKGRMTSAQAVIALPVNLPQQKIKSLSLDPEPSQKSKDRWDQPVAVFEYHDIPTNETARSVMTVETEISGIRYFIFPDKVGSLQDIPQSIRQRYTANGSKYLTDDPFIRKTAREIVGDETRPYWMARRIFDYVRNQLEYKLEGGWNAAPLVLQRTTGSCSEYTFSFVALCRAAGLPARYVGAIVVRGDDASLDEVFHRWPEVYLPNYGWLPMDPQGGDKPRPRDRAMHIGNLSNRFLITTIGGGDSQYLGWYYNYTENWQADPQVRVNVETFAEWEPEGN